jgi:hypothetical protein
MKVQCKTYKEWKAKISTKKHTHWQYIDDWWFPTPNNQSKMNRGKFWHACRANWEVDVAWEDLKRSASRGDESARWEMQSGAKASPESCKTVCKGCGTEVPDNIKMIAALLSW